MASDPRCPCCAKNGADAFTESDRAIASVYDDVRGTEGPVGSDPDASGCLGVVCGSDDSPNVAIRELVRHLQNLHTKTGQNGL